MEKWMPNDLIATRFLFFFALVFVDLLPPNGLQFIKKQKQKSSRHLILYIDITPRFETQTISGRINRRARNVSDD